MKPVPRLTSKGRVLVALPVAAILLAAGIVWWAPWHHTATKPSSTSPPAIAVIEITPSGFLPSTLSVNPNTNVVWVNEDVAPHLPAADPYPTHGSMPSLVPSRALGQHESYTFKVTHPETIHYHDDLQPTLTGTVVVR